MIHSPLKQGLEFIIWFNREATTIEFIIHVMSQFIFQIYNFIEMAMAIAKYPTNL